MLFEVCFVLVFAVCIYVCVSVGNSAEYTSQKSEKTEVLNLQKTSLYIVDLPFSCSPLPVSACVLQETQALALCYSAQLKLRKLTLSFVWEGKKTTL